MLEAPRIAGQKIVGLAVNRSQQDWLILRLQSDVARELETLRRVNDCNGRREQLEPRKNLAVVDGQVTPGLLNRVGRTQQLYIAKLP